MKPATENELMPVEADYVIRQMRETDISAVVALERLIFPDAWPADSFCESLNVPDGGGLVVESKNGPARKLLAYACFYSAAGETHVTNFAVAPDYRRRGIANKMLQALYEKAQASVSDAMFLEVRASNEPARKLYENHGFQELYRRKNYYHDPREDAVVYTREFSRTSEHSAVTKSLDQSDRQNVDRP